MNDYSVKGYDLRSLFDPSVPLIGFDSDLKQSVPGSGSLIYTVWNLSHEFIYVGIAGIQKDAAKRQGLTRLRAHASGMRSGDQFCIYVHDFYVLPGLMNMETYTPERGYLDRLTKDYIRKNLRFRVMGFQELDSVETVRMLEDLIKKGIFGYPPPALNGITD